MRIPISEIKINPGRREVLSKRVSELAKSIAEVGLLNPITLNRDNTDSRKKNYIGKSESLFDLWGKSVNWKE